MHKETHPDPLAGHPKYETVHRICTALFGFVVLARHRQTQKLVAIRWFDNRLRKGQFIPLEDKDCLSQLAEQMRLSHPCVLDVKEAIACPPYFGLVMELAPDGDVWQWVVQRGGLPEEEARGLFQQLVLAMDYCHAKGAACKDMRLEHAFMVRQPGSTPLMKVRQFDYSALLKDLMGEWATPSRTAQYLAPEVVQYLNSYDAEAADAWMAGVMLYNLLFSCGPFDRPEDAGRRIPQKLHHTLQRIVKADYHFPPSPTISEGCQDLISRLLVADPAQRLAFHGILTHPWFKQDLPPALLEQHVQALQREAGHPQTEEQLRAIVDEVVAANAKADEQADPHSHR